MEDDRVGAVPLLDDLQALVDLAAEVRVGEVVTDERGPHGSAEFFQRLVGRVFRPAARERRRTCSDSAIPRRSAVAYLTSWSYC